MEVTTLIFSAASLIVSFASLILAAASIYIAKSSLYQAELTVEQGKQPAESTQRDWAQRKWYDLYFKVDEAYNALERFQATYIGANQAIPSLQQQHDHNAVMFHFRESITMATVFPKNSVLDELFKTMDFSSPMNALSSEKLKALSDAIERLRQKALLDKRVLDTVAGKTENL